MSIVIMKGRIRNTGRKRWRLDPEACTVYLEREIQNTITTNTHTATVRSWVGREFIPTDDIARRLATAPGYTIPIP